MFKYLLTLLAITSFSSHAEVISNWKTTITNNYKNTYVLNQDDSEFGLTCKEQCFFYVNHSINCIKDREDLTLIINSIGNTLLVKNKCIKHDDAYFYLYDSFDEISNLVKDDLRIQVINDLNLSKRNQSHGYLIRGLNKEIENFFTSARPK